MKIPVRTLSPPSKERMNDEIFRRTKNQRSSGKKPGGQIGRKVHKFNEVVGCSKMKMFYMVLSDLDVDKGHDKWITPLGVR